MYDYMLGGRENFQADRDAARRLLDQIPEIRHTVRDNRAFMRRAVQYLTEQGVGQFLDIGAGLHTEDTLHDVAHEANPDAKVAYADRDELVVSHGHALLAKSKQVIVVQADLREPRALLGLPSIREHLDFTAPVALFLLQVLHFVPDDDDPAGIVDAYKDALCPGSYLIIGHVTADHVPQDITARVLATYKQASDNLWPRGKEQIMRFFDGFELVEPGLAAEYAWRPGPDGVPARTMAASWVGVSKKP
jgi:hypothetical protein